MSTTDSAIQLDPDVFDVSEQGKSASTLELFFDLVFVFAFTQVTSFLVEHQTWVGLAQGAAILAVVWRAWVAYSWLTGAASAEKDVVERLILLGGMTFMAAVALSIPDAFGDTALIFGVTYFIARLFHVILYYLVAPSETRAALHRLTPGWVGGPALLVVAGFVDGLLASILWIAAIIFEYGIVFGRSIEGFQIDIGHFIERHQLIVIVALGESIIAIGIAVGTEELLSSLVVGLATFLGFALIVALWWLYFDYTVLVAGQQLARMSGYEQVLLAHISFSGLHLLIVGSIIFIAFGIEQTLAHVNEPLGPIAAIGLCGGSTLYLLGHTAWQYNEYHTVNGARLTVAVAIVGLIFVAGRFTAFVILTALTGFFVGLAAYETVYSEDRKSIRRRYFSQND
ncbi:low temperature requirement protein A [Haladaptatus salinisoli]|uniref:low temperature requirement protein A n=1 Tax=Haladaptatus salinisoli TaxID=2884876 RepID=UPI001D0B857D|nr:low temperature requirement protein A [Haladaptatus salinisoli]